MADTEKQQQKLSTPVKAGIAIAAVFMVGFIAYLIGHGIGYNKGFDKGTGWQ